MKLTKAKILLDKINRLYKSMSLDEENVAAIEKDLMRDYIKQLYETFMHEEVSAAPIRAVRTPPKPTYTPPAPPVIKKKVEIAPPPPPPVLVEQPIAKVERPAPKVVETPPPPPPPPVVETPYIAVPPTRPKKVTPKTVVDPEHADLFNISMDAKELSEKLGQSKIRDLNNAMGLNERIFTVNELFGADNSLYRTVIKDLNNLKTFDEAKAYLSANVAEKYNWTHKSKRNKAKIFIKLVRRRYL